MIKIHHYNPKLNLTWLQIQFQIQAEREIIEAGLCLPGQSDSRSSKAKDTKLISAGTKKPKSAMGRGITKR